MYHLLIDEMSAYFRDQPADLDSVALWVAEPIFAFLDIPQEVQGRWFVWSTTHPVWGAPAMLEQLAAVRAALTDAVKQNVEAYFTFLEAQVHALEHLGWRNQPPMPSA